MTWVSVDEMDKLFFRKIEKKYKTSDNGYYGTVSRDELRDIFINLETTKLKCLLLLVKISLVIPAKILVK